MPPHQGHSLPAHSRALLEFKVHPALLEKKENEESVVSLDLAACPDLLASV